MFINDILNDDNYNILYKELRIINDTHRKFINDRLDFRKVVSFGLEGLVSGRILTGISEQQGSSYYVGLNSNGLGLYFMGGGYQSRIETETFLPAIKSMCTNEIESYLIQNIKKKSKQIRFLDVIKSLRKYECEEVKVEINREIPIVDPTDCKCKYEYKKIIVSRLKIRSGELYGIINDHVLDNSVNVSNFLVLEQVSDEIKELKESYIAQMDQRMLYNRLTKKLLEEKLSGYFAAKSI